MTATKKKKTTSILTSRLKSVKWTWANSSLKLMVVIWPPLQIIKTHWSKKIPKICKYKRQWVCRTIKIIYPLNLRWLLGRIALFLRNPWLTMALMRYKTTLKKTALSKHRILKMSTRPYCLIISFPTTDHSYLSIIISYKLELSHWLVFFLYVL